MEGRAPMARISAGVSPLRMGLSYDSQAQAFGLVDVLRLERVRLFFEVV